MKKKKDFVDYESRKELVDKLGMWGLALAAILALISGIWYGGFYLRNYTFSEEQIAVMEDLLETAKSNPDVLDSITFKLEDYPEEISIRNGELQDITTPVATAIVNSFIYSLLFLVLFVFIYGIFIVIISTVLLPKEKNANC